MRSDGGRQETGARFERDEVDVGADGGAEGIGSLEMGDVVLGSLSEPSMNTLAMLVIPP